MIWDSVETILSVFMLEIYQKGRQYPRVILMIQTVLELLALLGSIVQEPRGSLLCIPMGYLNMIIGHLV